MTAANESPAALGGPRRRGRLLLALCMFALFPAAWVAQALVSDSGGTVCFFRHLTGRPCPFCGLTHALGHAACGWFRTAFQDNPLWPIPAAVLLTIGFVALADACTGKDRLTPLFRVARRYAWPAVFALVLVALLRWWC